MSQSEDGEQLSERGAGELSTEKIVRRVRQLVKSLLLAGGAPADITVALAYVGTELGLAVAPDPIKVFPVVLSAVARAATNRQVERGADVDDPFAELPPTGASIH